MSTWKPITREEMAALLLDELAKCDVAEQAKYEEVRVPLRQVQFDRAGTVDPVYVVAEREKYLLIYDDVECGFEWCRPDSDGVIRRYACSQSDLQARMYELVKYDLG
ncbi:MAG TPA: hypothetical protein PLE36_12815 [Deltaproteobacteria bacterium]|nr:hypothetical protein [Deltaproteobacteria bacterium]